MKPFNLRKAIPVFAITLVIIGAIITYSILSNNETGNKTEDSSWSDFDYETLDIAQIKNQFVIGNKNYIILSEEQKTEFGLTSEINENDIGNKLADITTTVDADLMGSEVYQYLPAGGEAVVVVQKDDNYRLFKFFTFESYNNNQDEDANAYLELYGIHSAADIAKIQFIGHSEVLKLEGRLDIINEITDSSEINDYYNYYSVIKNSSNYYFDKLFNYKNTNNIPITDIGSDTIIDKGETGAASSSEGSEGFAGDALNNSVTIRIYNQKGLYFDAEYYPNLGFISRHEVNDDFAAFLKNYIG